MPSAACNAPTAISARTPRQRLHLRRGRQCDRDRLPRLPRRGRANMPICAPRARPRRPRHQSRGDPQRGRPPALRMDGSSSREEVTDMQCAVGQRADPALDRRSRASGWSARSTTASIATLPSTPAPDAPALLQHALGPRQIDGGRGRRDRPISCSAPACPTTSSPIPTARWPASPATSSWTTSCGGCHLPIEANWRTTPTIMRARKPAISRPTTRRSRARTCSSSAGTRPARAISSPRSARPRRWSCPRPTSTASGSTSSSRRSPPSGFSSQAFAPHFPHTVRTTETKTCSRLPRQRGQRQ